MAHFGTTRGIYIRAECDLTGVQFELIGLVFIIRIFDIKLFATTERAFHNSIPNNTFISLTFLDKDISRPDNIPDILGMLSAIGLGCLEA